MLLSERKLILLLNHCLFGVQFTRKHGTSYCATCAFIIESLPVWSAIVPLALLLTFFADSFDKNGVRSHQHGPFIDHLTDRAFVNWRNINGLFTSLSTAMHRCPCVRAWDTRAIRVSSAWSLGSSTPYFSREPSPLP